jgi:uncharacterized protein Yka (UPF0111/DUF47 family)
MSKFSEKVILKKLKSSCDKIEKTLDEIESLLKQGYSMTSPEVAKLQKRLSKEEEESNRWRQELLPFIK